MEIMNHIKDTVNDKKMLSHIYFAIPPLLLIIFAVFLYFDNAPFPVNVYNQSFDRSRFSSVLSSLPSPLLLSLVVYIWFFVSPLYCRILSKLEDAFEEAEYHNLYHEFYQWSRQFALIGSSKSSWIKAVYLFIWNISNLYFLYCVQKLAILPKGVPGAVYICLILITNALNFSSYFICMAFIQFLKKVSALEHLDYNMYIPSATYGFQRLRKAANTTYLFFLADSFLCMAAGIYFIIKNKPAISSLIDFIRFGYISAFLAFWGLLSFLYITFEVKYNIYSLFEQWKEQSFFYLEQSAKKADSQNLQDINEQIRALKQDKISVNIMSMIGFISTFLMNIFGVVTSILTILNV